MNIWKGKFLTEVLPIGHVLIVSGKIKTHPNRMTLDLTNKINTKNESERIFLKIELNFRENQIKSSIFRPNEGSSWRQEDITKCPKNSLESAKVFNFRIAALQKHFEIYINDNLCTTFEFTTCPKDINYMLLYGDFERITQFHQRALFPLVFPKTLICTERIAFHSDVPKNLEIGTVVTMECIARGPSSAEFSICFQCNDTGRMILKFRVHFERATIYRSHQREDNSFSSDDEETDGEFPFIRGKAFKIAFGLSDRAFIIAVNGQYLNYYNYPYSRFTISTLKCFTNCVGDLTLNSLEYHSDSTLLARVERLSII